MARTLRLALTVLVATTTFLVSRAEGGTSVAPPGDHYLCYKAKLPKGQPKFAPVQRSLEDQFGKATFDVKRIVSLCNPAQKNTEPPPGRPDVHEVGYGIAPIKKPPQPKFVKSTHTAIDQFGTHAIVVVKPDSVLAPSAKALGTGGVGLVDTAGIDHFECYRTATPKGTVKFTPIKGVLVADQFGPATYDLKKIAHLCTPVNKADEDPTAPLHPGHLVCYTAALSRTSPAQKKFAGLTVSVNNDNFGRAVLAATAVAELCVPALKDTTATTTSTTETTTSTTIIPCHTDASLTCAGECPGGYICGVFGSIATGNCQCFPPQELCQPPGPGACNFGGCPGPNAFQACNTNPQTGICECYEPCGANPTMCSGVCPTAGKVCAGLPGACRCCVPRGGFCFSGADCCSGNCLGTTCG